MTTADAALTKRIRFNVDGYDAYVGDVYVGSFRNNLAADVACDEYIYDGLTHTATQLDGGAVEVPSAAVAAARGEGRMPASHPVGTVVRTSDGVGRVVRSTSPVHGPGTLYIVHIITTGHEGAYESYDTQSVEAIAPDACRTCGILHADHPDAAECEGMAAYAIRVTCPQHQDYDRLFRDVAPQPNGDAVYRVESGDWNRIERGRFVWLTNDEANRQAAADEYQLDQQATDLMLSDEPPSWDRPEPPVALVWELPGGAVLQDATTRAIVEIGDEGAAQLPRTPEQVLVELAASAQDAGDKRGANAANKALYHLTEGRTPRAVVGGYVVHSGTQAGVVYRVERRGDVWVCNCPAGLAGAECWHGVACEAQRLAEPNDGDDTTGLGDRGDEGDTYPARLTCLRCGGVGHPGRPCARPAARAA